MLRRCRFAARLALTVAIAGSTTAGHSAPDAPAFAAPEIIMVHGSALPQPRVISTWKENHALLLSVSGRAPFPFTALDERPALRLALFWGSWWRSTAESPERLRALRPEQASQRGTFYPATGSEPALMIVGQTAGVVSDSGLAILRRHGVPIRLP